MPTVSNAARATTKDGAVWRTCTTCGVLAALAPDVEQCTACQPTTAARRSGPAVLLRAEHFASDDLFGISTAGSVFAEAIADIAHHFIGDPGCWDCYGSPPDELARLRDALDRMQTAIRETRADLAVIERRARRKAARQAGHTRQVKH